MFYLKESALVLIGSDRLGPHSPFFLPNANGCKPCNVTVLGSLYPLGALRNRLDSLLVCRLLVNVHHWYFFFALLAHLWRVDNVTERSQKTAVVYWYSRTLHCRQTPHTLETHTHTQYSKKSTTHNTILQYSSHTYHSSQCNHCSEFSFIVLFFRL